MDTIILFNQNNQSFKANVIRYFSLNSKNYLIMSMNEYDEQGYVKLYVMNVENVSGSYKTHNLIDEKEWSSIKELIQKIVIDNRKVITFEGDLEFENLNGLSVNDYKVFKLKKETAEELAKNKSKASVIANLAEQFNHQIRRADINQVVDEDEVATNDKGVEQEEKPVVINNEEKPKYTIESDFFVKQKENTDTNDYKKLYEEAILEIEKLRSVNIKITKDLLNSNIKLNEIKKVVE